MSTLLDSQRLFNEALQVSLFGEDREAAGLSGGEAAAPQRFTRIATTLIVSEPKLTAPERLNLYQRQYWFRLLDSLLEDFPRLEKLLGRAALLAEFEHYLRVHPPGHWNLRQLGAGLASFVARSRRIKATLRPLARDLAKLDFASTDLVEAPLHPYPEGDALATLPLGLQPCVRLLSLRTPVSFWIEHGQVPASKEVRPPELHLCWRDRGERLRSRTEAPEFAPLLRALSRGGRLADIIQRTRKLPAAELIQSAFQRWQQDGLLSLSLSVS